MKVFQVRLKLYLLKDIAVSQMQEKLTSLIDKGFAVSESMLQMHEDNRFKNYCYDMPYPVEKDKVYKRGKVYTLTIRTIDIGLARYFSDVCVNSYTDSLKALTSEVRIIPQKFIQSIYTLTPAILKGDKGYWRGCMTLEEYEERMKVNLIKKWNAFENEKMDENFQLYIFMEFLNKVPIMMEYKGIKLWGDKFSLQIADNASAQKLAYMSLGTGILEMNSRGAGFVSYKWL